MSKRWVKLSRGVLLGTLMIMGSGQAEEPRDTIMVPTVVEAVIEDATQPVPAQVAEADQPTTVEQVEREAADAVDMMLPTTDVVAQQAGSSSPEPSSEAPVKDKLGPEAEGTAQEDPPTTEGSDSES